ncbi:MAG: archaellin/type IV pilin N-terminal domain-containing protein [Candidatus Aenigmatarchaeota archaeon]
MRKGLSPLVAAVLLIGATMVIATILTYWASNFIRSSLSGLENQTYSQCIYADFKVYSCRIVNSTPTKGNITMILKNTMGVELRNLTATVFYSEASKEPIKNYNIPDNVLPANNYKFFNIVDVDLPFNKLVITTNCPNVEAESSC